MNRNKLIPAILGLLLLLQGGNLLYSLLIRHATVINGMSPLFKIGLYGLVFGGIYYFAALFGFFMQPENSDPGATTIAGRPFKTSRSLANPTNHIIVSSLLLFASFGLLLYALVLG